MSAKQSAAKSSSKQDTPSKQSSLSLDKKTASSASSLAKPSSELSATQEATAKAAAEAFKGKEMPNRGKEVPNRGKEIPNKGKEIPKGKEVPNNKETPKDKEAMPKNTEETPKGKSGWLLFLLFLLILLAFAGTAGLGWLGYQQIEGLQKQLADRPTHQQLRAPLNNLNAIDDLKERQLYLQQTSSSHRLELADIQQALAKSSDPKPRDWQLAEVEYLLRLANQRLQLEDDVESALTIMRTADQRLRQANVAGTLGIRSYLLEDIEKLKALPKLDRISMALSLQSLADKALTLKVQGLSEVPALDLEAIIQFDNDLKWYEHLWQEVRGLVIVRKRELPIEALPFAEDELVLRHQLSALLLQASWAALRSEQPLYDASLTAAAKRLTGFDASQPEIADFMQEFSALAQQPVKQKLPDTETSLNSLQDFIAERYNLELPLEVEGSDLEVEDSNLDVQGSVLEVDSQEEQP